MPPSHIITIIIVIIAVGLGLYVLSYVTSSLSGDSVQSIFFLDSLYPFFHGSNTVELLLVSSCFPFFLHLGANFVGNFSDLIYYTVLTQFVPNVNISLFTPSCEAKEWSSKANLCCLRLFLFSFLFIIHSSLHPTS